jgi:hypothetical protein
MGGVENITILRSALAGQKKSGRLSVKLCIGKADATQVHLTKQTPTAGAAGLFKSMAIGVAQAGTTKQVGFRTREFLQSVRIYLSLKSTFVLG